MSLFCRLGFALVGSFFFAIEGEDEEAAAAEDNFFPLVECGGKERFPPLEEEVEDLIFASSASKAGARVLTTASRSDWFDRDWTADVSSSFLASLSALLDFFCWVDDLSGVMRDGLFSCVLVGDDRSS